MEQSHSPVRSPISPHSAAITDAMADRSADLIVDPAALFALARQGSAAAHQALGRSCRTGPVERRCATLRLLPGLIPFQPVWSILDQVDRPSTPQVVRRTVATVRPLIGDPRDCEPIYRAAQETLVVAFSGSERERLRRFRRQRRRAGGGHDSQDGLPSVASQVRAALLISRSLYDYRFESSDGCLGDLQKRHIEEFLLEYAPRRLLLEPEMRRCAPEVLVRHFRWLGDVGRLLPSAMRVLCRHSLALARRYRTMTQQTAQPGSPRALLRAARVAGVSLLDPRALHRHMSLEGLDLHEEFLPIWESEL